MEELDLDKAKIELYESFGDELFSHSAFETFYSSFNSKFQKSYLQILRFDGKNCEVICTSHETIKKPNVKTLINSNTDGYIYRQKEQIVGIVELRGDHYVHFIVEGSSKKIIQALAPIFKKFGNYFLSCVSEGDNKSDTQADQEQVNETSSQNKIAKSQNIFEHVIIDSTSAIDIIQFEKSDVNLERGKLFIRNNEMKKYLGHSGKPLYSKEVFLKLAAKSKLGDKSPSEIYDKMFKSIITEKLTYDDLTFDLGGPRDFTATHQLLEFEDKKFLIRTLRDVTQEREAQNLMRNQKITLDAVLDSTPDGIYAVDKDFKVIAINKQAKKDFIAFENLKIDLGTDLKAIIEPEIFDSWNEKYFSKVFSGESLKYIGEAKENDGEIRYVENQYSPVIGLDGDVYACLELSRDITDLYKKEKALIKSESQYKNLIETSTAGIVQANQDGIITFASVQAAKIHGIKPKDMVGHHCLEFLHSDTKKEGKGLIDDLFKLKIEVNRTLRAKHIDEDKKLFVDVKASYLLNKDDDSKGHFLLTYFDVSDKISAEYKLNKTKASFNLLYTNTTNPIFIYDTVNNKFKMANNAALELLEYSEAEFAEMSWEDIIDKNPAMTEYAHGLSEIDSVQEKSKIQRVLISKSKTQRYCDISILSANDKNTEDFIVIQDNTEQINKNNQLKRYIESNLQLENFAYIASHDLKAPLRTVSSFAHLLKSNSYKDLDEKGKSFLDIVLDNSKHMQLLIDDLLEFSRINTQDAKIRKLDMRNVMLRVISQLKSTLEDTQTELTYDEFPDKLYGDESMLIQLFQNLISNSVKFVKKGVTPKIHISYEELPKFHKFCLEDNGIGISEKNMEIIFKIFKKLHNHDSYNGTGLGLTICKRIVEKHFGKIWIESSVNEGSKFYFTVGKTNLTVRNIR